MNLSGGAIRASGVVASSSGERSAEYVHLAWLPAIGHTVTPRRNVRTIVYMVVRLVSGTGLCVPLL